MYAKGIVLTILALLAALMSTNAIPFKRIGTQNATSGRSSIDLGLNRGYSGAQVIKANIGIKAANNPRGPGRRKRSLLNKENDTKTKLLKKMLNFGHKKALKDPKKK
ncbi:UNVERIFIED_CONTAM: hypothetical protein RMT77_014372 [Armadillidium vulgare]